MLEQNEASPASAPPVAAMSERRKESYAILDANPVYRDLKLAYEKIAVASNGTLEVAEIRHNEDAFPEALASLSLRTKDYGNAKPKLVKELIAAGPNISQQQADAMASPLVHNMVCFYASGEVSYAANKFRAEQINNHPYDLVWSQGYDMASYLVNSNDLNMPEIAQNRKMSEADLVRIGKVPAGQQTNAGNQLVADIINNAHFISAPTLAAQKEAYKAAAPKSGFFSRFTN